MIIKKYRDLPVTYTPDVGEVIMGRRSVVDKYTRAVVTCVHRLPTGAIKMRVTWRADNPEPGARGGKPIKAGDTGWIVYVPGAQPSTIMQISKDQAPE